MEPRRTPSSREAAYFPVSPVKLVALSICTLGGYQIYWTWVCWDYIRFRDGRKLNPFWRSVYVSSLFFNVLLFRDVFLSAGSSRSSALAASTFLALLYAASWLCGLLFPDSPWSALVLVGPLVLVPVQWRINAFNATEHPYHDPNRAFSNANLAVVVLGGPLLVALFLSGWFTREA